MLPEEIVFPFRKCVPFQKFIGIDTEAFFIYFLDLDEV